MYIFYVRIYISIGNLYSTQSNGDRRENMTSQNVQKMRVIFSCYGNMIISDLCHYANLKRDEHIFFTDRKKKKNLACQFIDTTASGHINYFLDFFQLPQDKFFQQKLNIGLGLDNSANSVSAGERITVRLGQNDDWTDIRSVFKDENGTAE